MARPEQSLVRTEFRGLMMGHSSGSLAVCYVSIVDVSLTNGASDHVLGFCSGLVDEGHSVVLIAPASKSLVVPDGVRHIRSAKFSSGVLRAFLTSTTLRRQLTAERPDVVYLRAFPFDWLAVAGVAAAAAVPLFVEINTMVVPEYRALGQGRRARLVEFFDRRTLRAADGWLPVTTEIGEYASSVADVERPQRLALNGYRPVAGPRLLERTDAREALDVSPGQRVLLLLGAAFGWHGALKAAEALERLDDRHVLWVVDPSPGERTILEANRRIRTFGPTVNADLDQLLAAADVGLGPMAIELKAMTEAQPLKVATYLGYGIPVVTNYSDIRRAGDPAFWVRAAGGGPSELADAVMRVPRRTDELTEEIVRYASNTISWQASAMDAVDFIAPLLP